MWTSAAAASRPSILPLPAQEADCVPPTTIGSGCTACCAIWTSRRTPTRAFDSSSTASLAAGATLAIGGWRCSSSRGSWRPTRDAAARRRWRDTTIPAATHARSEWGASSMATIGSSTALSEPIVARIKRSVIVTRVGWRPGTVAVHSRAAAAGGPQHETQVGRARPIIHARRVVITVPLGVLKAPPGETGSIDFIPALTQKAEALERMAMGSVMRVVLRFKTRFWTAVDFERRAGGEALESLAFVQSDDEDFPVWWTQYPLRAPVMVGWRGGPRARVLDRLPPDRLADCAIASLARALGLSRRRLRAMVEGTWSHRWDADPLTRGAYSYQLVGGATAPDALARPVRGTLFFAGEATAPDGRIGSVDGAIASGLRAARQVRRAFAQER